MNSDRILSKPGNMAIVWSSIDSSTFIGTWIYIGKSRTPTLRDDAYEFIFTDSYGRIDRCTYLNATIIAIFNSDARDVKISEVST